MAKRSNGPLSFNGTGAAWNSNSNSKYISSSSRKSVASRNNPHTNAGNYVAFKNGMSGLTKDTAKRQTGSMTRKK